jgi:hypothetical protein
MNISAAIPDDELILGRLACAKLAGMVQGIMSVGLASLELQSSVDFLTGRDRPHLGFIEVLSCISVRPGSAEAWKHLSDEANAMRNLFGQFYECLIRLSHWRNTPSADVLEATHRLIAAYVALFQSLQAFSDLLGMGADYSRFQRQGQQMASELCQHILTGAAKGERKEG